MIAGVDPGTADQIVSANGDIEDNGNLDTQDAANDLGLNVDSSYSATEDDIPNAVANSDVVVARVANGSRSHYVVITGAAVNPTTNECDYTIADPGTSYGTGYLSKYSVTMLVQVSYQQ